MIEHKNIRQTWRGNVRIAPSSLPFFGTAAEPPSHLAGVEDHRLVGIKKKKFLTISRLEAESSLINQKKGPRGELPGLKLILAQWIITSRDNDSRELDIRWTIVD